MWINTEKGILVNLDTMESIQVMEYEDKGKFAVICLNETTTYRLVSDLGSVMECQDIIKIIFDALRKGTEGLDLRKILHIRE